MWTFDEVLADELLTVLTRYDSAGIFELHIGNLETVVTIDLGRFMDTEKTKFRRSHAIKTPLQMRHYIPSDTVGDYPAEALHTAVRSLTHHYREAVRAGHEPREDWLVKI